jgi:hypothetical protein
MSSPIVKLNLSPKDESLLKSMGFNTLEKIVLVHSDELGLGRGKGEAVQKRAMRILARDNIKRVSVSEDFVSVELLKASRGVVVSVEHVFDIPYSDLKTDVQDNKLFIFKLKPAPCSECGRQPEFWCKQCNKFFCVECRGKHEHYYNIRSLKDLEEDFKKVAERAKEYEPKPPEYWPESAIPDSEIVEFAGKIGFSSFAESFFSELKGNDIMKKAITCALFSTPEEPVHVLVVGDPAGGKTLAKDTIAAKLGKEVELVGANTTRAGLVCNMATGELGVLAYANGKIVLVDEFDKIPEREFDWCYELLSNGKCSVHSAKVHETIESHFVMIAFANPTGIVFGREPINEIPVPPILASRFAFIVKAEELGEELVKEVVKRKLLGEGPAYGEFSKYYLPWLRKARKYNPKFTASKDALDNYVNRIYDVYERFLKTPLRRDLRMAEYAKRVPLAIARAKFSDVDDGVLADAMRLIDESLKSWS